MANRKVIAIGAHPDDYELGAAMRLMFHALQGDDVVGIICTDGERGGKKGARLKEAGRAADFIGMKKVYFLHYPDTRLYEYFNELKEDLEKIISRENPVAAYLHFPHDQHQDHETASHASSIACRNVPNIFFYKTPATTLASFQPHIFHVGSKGDFLRKKEALLYYKSQIQSGSVDMERVKADLRFYCFCTCRSPKHPYAEPFCANHIVLNAMEGGLMEEIDINSDFHMHTNFTDGASSVQEMIQAANKKGLAKIAITEHVRADSPWVDEYIEAVQDERKSSRSGVIIGFETKLLDMDGTLDISKAAKNRAELIVCSLHRIPGLNVMEGDTVIRKLDPHKTKEAYLEALKAICRNKSVDIIGHPFDLLYKFNAGMPAESEMHCLAEYIAAHKKAVEINTRYCMPSPGFIRICMLHGVKFSIGSDAHHASKVGNISWALEALKSAGGSKKDLMEALV